ncbi:site-2 protease family protein [Gemmatimonas aurantiaca]|nr:site-2 protease family protein [Gemmatimonas aurantiaca]
MFDADFLQRAIVAGPIIVLSLTIHEFAHAWSALKFGDDTAARMGRLTFNPLAHLDMMGTLVMVMSNFSFGWAKPVPVNLSHVKDYRVADFWISFAGPISNFIQASIASMIYNVMAFAPGSYGDSALRYAVFINLTLALFNMIPLFPLDGSHMLRSVLPKEYEEPIGRFERIAPMILIGLIVIPNIIPGFPNLFSMILWPIILPIAGFLL